MTQPSKYNLLWSSIQLNDIEMADSIPESSGVYSIVLNAASKLGMKWTVIYIGESVNLRSRYHTHLKDWFTSPNSTTWIPTSAEDFINDPVIVFNNNGLKQGLPDRDEIMSRVRMHCMFCFAPLDLSSSDHELKHLEYVLQEGVKLHAGIKVSEEIGDKRRGRPQPSTDLIISNRYVDPQLSASLPHTIGFVSGQVRNYMQKPNIFPYATKELSLEAVVCWLIELSKYGTTPELRLLGRNFVESLLNDKNKNEVDLSDGIQEVEIYKQDNYSDVLARINGKHVLLIENKTDGEIDVGQIGGYRDDVLLKGKTKLEKVCKEDVYTTFVKTGYVYGDEREKAERAGHRVFDANEFLDVLQDSECTRSNDIVHNFFEYLANIVDERQRAFNWFDMSKDYVLWEFMVKLSKKLDLHTREKWPARSNNQYSGTSWTQFPHWNKDREGKIFFWRLDSCESCNEPNPLRLMVQTDNISGGRERFLDFVDEWYAEFAKTAESLELTLAKFNHNQTRNGKVIKEPPIGAVNIDNCLKREGIEKCIERVSHLYERFTDAVDVE